jgi:hypothetical protein
VVAYRRVHEDEAVEVYLNFSRRACKLDLTEPRARGRVLFSTRRAELTTPEPRYSLAPYEGVILLDSR